MVFYWTSASKAGTTAEWTSLEVPPCPLPSPPFTLLSSSPLILPPNLRPPSPSTLPLRGAGGSSGSWGDFPGGRRVPPPKTPPISQPKISNSQKITIALGISSNLQMDYSTNSHQKLRFTFKQGQPLSLKNPADHNKQWDVCRLQRVKSKQACKTQKI